MAVKFYNPASRITETIRFDSPLKDDKGQPLVAYHNLEVPAESFFEVPTELVVQIDGEPVPVAVSLPKIIREQYRYSHCVVMVDPAWPVKKKPISDEDNVALTEEKAEAKAKVLWKDAMYSLVRQHEDRVREAKEAGRRPLRALGNIKHALNALGVEDPANDVEDVLKRKQDDTETQKLRAELDEMKKLVMNMATKGK
jgi:hypothetical protein